MNNKKSAELKAKEYLFDLRNVAIGNGFKPDEKWLISFSTQAYKAVIGKKYYATVATKASPEDVFAMFALAQTGLNHPITNTPDIKTIGLNQLQYLIAYKPERERQQAMPINF